MREITLFLLVIIHQFCISQNKESSPNSHKVTYVKPNQIEKENQKSFRPLFATGMAITSDLYSNQIGNAIRFVVVSNQGLQIVNEYSNYSRFNYLDNEKKIREKEMGILVNYGYSNKKKFYLYGIMGLVHRLVLPVREGLISNKCNSFSVGGGTQLNFSYFSAFIESRLVKQDYSSEFVGVFYSGNMHPVITMGITVHTYQEIEKYVRIKKRKKVGYKKVLKKKENKTITNCTYF